MWGESSHDGRRDVCFTVFGPVNLPQPDFRGLMRITHNHFGRGVPPAFYASPSIWGDVTQSLVRPRCIIYLRRARAIHHGMYYSWIICSPVNDSKYSGGCEGWFGKLPRVPASFYIRLVCGRRRLDSLWILSLSVSFGRSALNLERPVSSLTSIQQVHGA